MSTEYLWLYVVASVWILWQFGRALGRPIGATFCFLGFVILFHVFAYPYYVYAWSDVFRFGLLPVLSDESNELVPHVTLAMSVCYLGVMLGCFLGRGLFGSGLGEGARREGPGDLGGGLMSERSLKRTLSAAFAMEVVMCVMLIAQYAWVASPADLYNYYLSDLESAARVAIRRNSNLSVYVYSVAHLTIIPFVLFVLLAEAYYRESSYLKRRAARLAGWLLLVKLSTFTKAGPALLVAQVIMCLALAKADTLRFRPRHIVTVALALIVVFSFIFAVREESAPAAQIGLDFAYRMWMIPNEVIFEYFHAVPQFIPFGYGTGMSFVRGILGDVAGTGLDLPTHTLVAAVYRADYVTVVNSFFVAEAWAQYGWAGVIILSIIAGLLVKWYDRRIMLAKPHSVRLGMVIFAIGGTYALVTAAVTTAMVTGGLLVIPLFAVWMERGIRVKRRGSPGATASAHSG
jgi:hypothetical protein